MKKIFMLAMLGILLSLSYGTFATISGPTYGCVGSTNTFIDSGGVSGGTWSSSNTSVATIGATTGIISALSAGTTVISYIAGSFVETQVYTANALPASIAGPAMICAGSTGTYTDAMTGGIWGSYNPSIATIGSSTGIATGVSSGTATLQYLNGSTGCSVTMLISVNATPSGTISGPTTLCPTSTITLTDPITGGAWSSSSTGVATVSSGGVVTGVAAGTTTISYGVSGSCGMGYSTHIVTVSIGTIAGTITGPSSVCPTTTISLSDAVTGGVWSSSNPSAATVSSTGVVTGIAAGTTTISYAVTGCSGIAYATKVVTVTSGTSAGSIVGTATVVAGSTTYLSDTITGGTWTSSNTSIATVSFGTVTGVAAGTCTITYTVSGCSGTAYATKVVTVSAFNGISGHVLFTGSAYYGSVKVWLIDYTAPMLTAVDSITVYSSGSSAFYQFLTPVANTYRVKAAIQDSATVAGYIPTYHTSSAYWNTATTFAHITTVADINKDITMLTGTPTTGPGFIAGDVTMGANKGTAGTIPAAGLLMYVENDATGAVLQQTHTDAAGHYSFSNLPVGATYKIYPELINYATTPYTTINLTTGTPSMSVASFEQHTISLTITPIMVGVHNVAAIASSVSAYPNPTNGKMNISWNALNAEQGTISVADITGREVYHATINMAQGAGATMVDLSDLNNGLYLMSIKSASVNYNNKIQIQK
jgi:hypothetical protein